MLSDDYINIVHLVSKLTYAAQHMAGKKLFRKLDCSQAYHCVQMADQRSKEMLVFNFASRTFAYQRLAQGISRALSAFSSFMREYLDKVIKADQCAQYVDDICISANDADHLIANLRATSNASRRQALFHFRNVISVQQKLTSSGEPLPLKASNPRRKMYRTSMRRPTKIPKSKKALQRYLGFLIYYQTYVPRLFEHLAPFYKMLKNDNKVLVSKELAQQFEKFNKALDKCCDRALQQPLPNKRNALMTDASFTAAGYATLREDDPNQKYTLPHSANHMHRSPMIQKFSPQPK